MAHVPGLRSPYAKVGRLVYFGRMLDKIRLHAAGRLPADYVDNLGDSKPGVFDTRCCEFLGVPYDQIRGRTIQGGSDEEILAWVEARGTRRTNGECEVWNGYLMKRGFHDGAAAAKRLRQRVEEAGLVGKPIETFFDFIDYDEGRDPAATRPWESV
jgi:Domain of unknown function (DUF5069)